MNEAPYCRTSGFKEAFPLGKAMTHSGTPATTTTSRTHEAGVSIAIYMCYWYCVAIPLSPLYT